MNNQKPLQYDEKRFFVPENHPHYKELTAITQEYPFTLTKTGFDYYGIPFFFNEEGIVIGEGDNRTVVAPEDYSKWYDDFLQDCFDAKSFMTDNVIPHLNTMITQATEGRMKHTADEALEAYKRLATIEQAKLTFSTENTGLNNYEKKWESFHDILTLVTYLPDVSIIDNTEVSLFCYYVEISNKRKQNEKYIFYADDYDTMIKVFDALRPLLFQYEYSISHETTSVLRHIIENCQELAKLYTCYLDISLSNNSAKLLAVRQGSVEYATYRLFTDSSSECGIKELISDIKSCAFRKYNKDTQKFNNLTYDAINAITNFLRSI